MSRCGGPPSLRLGRLRTIFAALVATAPLLAPGSANAAFPMTDLSSFYVVHADPRVSMQMFCSYAVSVTEPNQAEIVIVGGAVEPPSVASACDGKVYRTIHRLVDVTPQVTGRPNSPADWIAMSTGVFYGTQRWFEPCWGARNLSRSTGLAGATGYPDDLESWNGFPDVSQIIAFGSEARCAPVYQPYPPGWRPMFQIKSDYLPQSPVRRRAVDGSEYDASPLIIKRAGVPWYTHFWAYRLGLVASENNFNDADRSKLPEGWNLFPSAAYNFELAKLPPPKIEDDIIEYVNRADFPAQPGGQYFYAVRAEDKTLLDSIPVWQRTGKSFKSGGYVSACRFYGGKNGGPNTHFYSADDKECAALKAIPQLSYEGQTFAVNVPLPGAAVDGVKPCPVASKPLYRVYNNASKSSGRFVSNHRYLTEKADVAAVVAQGWADEGQVMCVPQ
jgi:hypothetical protein